MKKYLPFLSLAFLLGACSSKPTETQTRTIQSTQTTTVDTAGLAQFQQWKAQNELVAANEPQQSQPQAAAAPVKTITIVREVRVPQPAPMRKTVMEQAPAPVITNTPAATKTDNSANTNGEVTARSESSNTAEAPATQPAETAKKKGWSNSTKGAVIGGVGGAVIGAVINKKNPVTGAVIGGVLGAGVGYGVGKNKDGKILQQQ